MSEKRIVEQLSIFVNNEAGSLAKMADTISKCDINIKSFNIAESIGFGVFRAIVDNPDEAYEKLTANGLIVKKTEILAVSGVNDKGYLHKIAKALGDAGISIEYAYTNKDKNDSILVRVNNIEGAIAVFDRLGVELLETKDL